MACRHDCLNRVQLANALLEMESLRTPNPQAALGAPGGGLLDGTRRPLYRTAGAVTLVVACAALVAISPAAMSSPPTAAADMTPVADESTSEPPIAESNEYIWHCTTIDRKTGTPIGGVRVAWELQRKQPIAEGTEPLWKGEFVSGVDGRYDVHVPKAIIDDARPWVRIDYDHPQYLPSRNLFWPLRLPTDPQEGLDHRHIHLEPGVKVTGRVQLPDGSPASNVPLMFARTRDGFGDSNGGFHHGFWTRTDREGRYQFYTRNTWPQRVHWFPDEYENNSRALTKDFGDQGTIRLRAGLTLAGTVLDQHGQPLPGIVMRAATGTRVPYLFATSNDKGIFQFAPLPPGQYALMAVRRYHDNATGDSLTAGLSVPIPAIHYQLDASTASSQPRAVVQAAPLVRIPVEVVDGAGEPLNDVSLSVGDLGDCMNAVLAKPVAGAPGKYEFLVPRDEYIRDLRVRVSMDEAAFYQLSSQFAPVAANAIVLGKATDDFPTIRAVVRQSGTLKVTARTKDGKEPAGNLYFDARYGPETAARIESAERANRQPSAKFMVPGVMHTNPAGQLWNPTFLQVAPGEPLIVTLRSDIYDADSQTVTLADGETRSVEFVVKQIDRSLKQ
ncbi:MAG: carboxypeptidase regulatory-like domain-containing protein [Pirellulaceae bacterium]